MKRIVILLTLLTVVCVPDMAWATPPDVLGSFSPGGVVPGRWESFAMPSPPPFGASCAGTASAWKRSDGVRLGLVWQRCDAQDREYYLKSNSLDRIRAGKAWAGRAVLGGADVVVPGPNGAISRSWVQSDCVLLLVAAGAGADELAAVTAQAARYLSARLPGTPVYYSGLPSFPRILSAMVVAWLLFAGIAIALQRLTRPAFDTDPRDRRLRAVDGAAVRLRRRHRGRRWGQFALVTGAPVFAGQLVEVAATGGPSNWPTAIACGLVWPAVGVVLLRRCRSQAHRSRPVAPVTVRRLAAAGLTVVVGLFAAALPIVVVLGAFFSNLLSTGDDSSMFIGEATVAALGVGWVIDRGAQRLRARNARELIDTDSRPYFLYLRCFGDDDAKLPATGLGRRGPYQVLTGWASMFRGNRFEEVFTRAVTRFGPVIAVDPPDTRLRRLVSARVSKLGAGKLGLPHEHWQAAVERMANSAGAVIVAAAPGDIRHGLRWEMRMLAERLPHGRVVLLLNPQSDKASTVGTFHRFLAETGVHAMFSPLYRQPPAEGTLVLVHSPAEGWGTWYGWQARARTAWTYTAAIEAALAFAETAWARPATTDPFRGMPVTEPVANALALAGRRATAGSPVGTAELLTALAGADTLGRWERVLLHTDTSHEDPAGQPVCCRGVVVTRTCEQTITAGVDIALCYGLVPVPPGAVVLGLLSNPQAGAAAVLGVTNQQEYDSLREVIESDLLGTSLERTSPAPVTAVPPPAPVPHVRSSRVSVRYKIWSFIGLCVVGFAFVGIGQDQGRAAIVPAAVAWVVLTALIMFAFAIANYTRWTAIRAALVGAFVLAAIAAFVYAVV